MSLYGANIHSLLTQWDRLTHLYVSKLNIIGSDNGLAPSRWTNAGILLSEPWGTNFSEFISEIYTHSFTEMHLKMLSAKNDSHFISA